MAAHSEPIAGYYFDVPANLSDKAVRQRLAPKAAKLFFRVTEAWKLKDEQTRALLGGVSNGKLYSLKNGDVHTLGQDELTRISLVIGIFKALNILYSEKLADRWMTLANNNPMFDGDTPIAEATRGGVLALTRIRQLLDSRRGGR